MPGMNIKAGSKKAGQKPTFFSNSVVAIADKEPILIPYHHATKLVYVIDRVIKHIWWSYPIEVVEDFLISSLRRYNDTISILQCLDIRGFASVLLSDKWWYICLDTTSTETNNDDGNNVSRKWCTWSNRHWDGCTNKNDQANKVDEGKDYNGLVLAQILVGNDSTDNLKIA